MGVSPREVDTMSLVDVVTTFKALAMSQKKGAGEGMTQDELSLYKDAIMKLNMPDVKL